MASLRARRGTPLLACFGLLWGLAGCLSDEDGAGSSDETNLDASKSRCEWGSWKLGGGDVAKHQLAMVAAKAAGAMWPQASYYLVAYLMNDGAMRTLEVGAMVAAEPRLAQQHLQNDQEALLALTEPDAVARLVAGETLTHQSAPVVLAPTTRNWMLAVGKYVTQSTYEVHAVPVATQPTREAYVTRPTAQGLAYYALRGTTVDAVWDLYDWQDSTAINSIWGLKVSDEELNRFHCVGIAKEYWIHGARQRLAFRY